MLPHGTSRMKAPSASTRRLSLPRGSRGALGGALAAALAITGCASSAPTQAQYVGRANAICRTASARTVPLVRQLTAAAAALSSGQASPAREATGALQGLHTTTSSTLAELRGLQQPTTGSATIKGFLGALETVDAALGRAATAAERGQFRQALAQLQAAAPAAQRTATAAGTYGMTQCATLFAGLGSTTPSGQVHATVHGENHTPTVGVPWRYTVTVTQARGKPVDGTETTHYTFGGAVVGTEKPENVAFTGGVYHDTIEFPARSVGYPLSLQAVVHTSQGSASAAWPIVVHPAGG